MPNSERRLADAFWDLRDDAYDNPECWQGVTADVLFQHLAEYVEKAEESGEPIDWRRVAVSMMTWRTSER